jgi:hypothetical protein
MLSVGSAACPPGGRRAARPRFLDPQIQQLSEGHIEHHDAAAAIAAVGLSRRGVVLVHLCHAFDVGLGETATELFRGVVLDDRSAPGDALGEIEQRRIERANLLLDPSGASSASRSAASSTVARCDELGRRVLFLQLHRKPSGSSSSISMTGSPSCLLSDSSRPDAGLAGKTPRCPSTAQLGRSCRRFRQCWSPAD